MQWFVENYASKMPGKPLRVLDIGSSDVNGSYKPLFAGDSYDYKGLDIEAGPNVDIVAENPYHWGALETGSFDIVISGQAFEHIEFFWLTMMEMARVLKKDGLLCIVAPKGFEEHRYPVDCYRFFTDGMVALARYVCLDILHAHTNCAPDERETEWYSINCADSFLVARKPYSGAARSIDPASYHLNPADHGQLRGDMKPFTVRFAESALAHKYLDGLKGIEIGGSAHNPFGLDTINIDCTNDPKDYFKNLEFVYSSDTANVDMVAQGDQLPFPDKSYDFVLSSHVIEHFYDPVKALLEWARVARKYLFIVVPHRLRTWDIDRPPTPVINLHRRYTGLKNDDDFCRDGHWSVFDVQNFNELCHLCGLKVEEIQDPDDKVGNGFTFVIRLD
jgi:ubiquinone/menaquinone biosynthesis C-methylase UbiE